MSLVTGMASLLGGALAGFVVGVLAIPALFPDVHLLAQGSEWVSPNLGRSVGRSASCCFAMPPTCPACASCWRVSRALKQVVQRDQLSDVWTNLFIGIGVVWTAIGMRSALATTLDAPGALNEDAGQVLLGSSMAASSSRSRRRSSAPSAGT
ncbi:MAG: hypothetical protein U5O39_07345 [Gammaproteobacteria bacterium]|nr:hypothetical protein [Gammaproteobacteria bacterium]